MTRRVTVNPVLSRELRQRVRSRRASVVLTVYLSLLVAVVALLVWAIEQSSSSDSPALQGVGQTVLGTLLFGILGLVCFIVPGVAAGAVAGERERLTLTPLQVTLLTPGQILRGKLLASLAFTTLLLVAALPLLAVAYVLGGVTVPQIAGGLLFVLASAAFLGVLSIWASTVLRRVQRATVVAYGMVGLLVVGTMIAYGVQVVTTTQANPDGDGGWESLLFASANPFVVTADALGHDVDVRGVSPFTPWQALLERRDERRRGSRGEHFTKDTPFGVPTVTAVPLPPPPSAAPMMGPAPGVSGPPPFVPVPTTVPGEASGGSGIRVVPTPDAGVFEPAAPPQMFPGRPPDEVIVEGVAIEGRDGDFTDRGPIWAWTFGWWVTVGGAAYLHATRKLRLPSAAGVRP